MNKSIIKKFAIESRQELMKKISNKIKTFYVEDDLKKDQKGDSSILNNDKQFLSFTKEEKLKINLLIRQIQTKSSDKVVEEAAYTWFNRIVAIRYMEINDYLPLTKDNQSLGIRVLSSNENTPNPEILKFFNLNNPDLDINFEKEKYMKLKNDNERFKYVLLLICKKLGKVIPQVFDDATDYVDILIPDNLLNESGFVSKIIKDVPEENFNEVEIIGWLYQYYNQTEKDRVISAKKTYNKDEIPYATQLFTPDWIVKYMVENSLGRYWVEHNDENISRDWKYFIKDNIVMQGGKLNPTGITFIDPCCGSGHILVYAFEVLYQIYSSAGYSKNEIPELILKNNLYGLDIDDRAGQLSILSILLKAREFDKNIFNKDVVKTLNIMSLQESNLLTEENLNFLKSNKKDDESLSINELIDYVYNIFQNAKEIGSLLIVDNKDYNKVIERIKKLHHQKLDLFTQSDLDVIESKFKSLLKQAIILSRKYDIVVTNPPYMNSSMMSQSLKKYVLTNYSDVKSDLFSSFILRNSYFGKKESYLGFMTPYVWMFISSYEKLRNYIITNMNISSLVQLEYSALEDATVPICTFVLKNNQCDEKGIYIKLSDFPGGMEVQEKMFLKILYKKSQNFYLKNVNKFKKIVGMPISYWVSDKVFNAFELNKTADISIAKCGMGTSDNNRFLRVWSEIDYNKVGFNYNNVNETEDCKYKWIPYDKGGEYRKWYGNRTYVVNFYNNAEEIREATKDASGGRVVGTEYYFKEHLSWGSITSSKISFRYFEKGFIFDSATNAVFVKNNEDTYYVLGYLNSKFINNLVNIINPTLNFTVTDYLKFPFNLNFFEKTTVCKFVKTNIFIEKADWDSFETSWDFKKHPLINMGITLYNPDSKFKEILLEDNYHYWETICNDRFNQLKQNEEELNEIFINIYGLQDELTKEVEDKDITIRKANKLRDIKSLISYAVGCMFGRYSLDEDGLIFAGGEFDPSRYKTFNVDSDNVIPITDEFYFNDDIVTKFKQFIEVAYGSTTLDENIDYIADVLGRKGTETSDATIRRYFINDFYNDHIKVYKKRPIYWLFDSGKKNGFKCLIYMHRYSKDIVATIRTKYIPKIQYTYEKLLLEVEYKLTTDLSLVYKKEMDKKKIELIGKMQEVKEYYEIVANVANKMIEIDLDDGVLVNYGKITYLNPKTKKKESILGKV